MEEPLKGKFTIRMAGFFFFISALFQLFSLKSGVPFLGSMLAGMQAVLFHLIYVVLFIWMGFVLWTGSRNGVKVIFGGTALFTLEKILLLTSSETLQLHIDQLVAFRPDLVLLMGPDAMQEPLVFMTWILLASWWGFAFYIYKKRAYFHS